MKPSIGRIVHYRAPEDCGGEVFGGFVTRVRENGNVDLATLGPTSLYFNQDVAFHEMVEGVEQPFNTCIWPPRV